MLTYAGSVLLCWVSCNARPATLSIYHRRTSSCQVLNLNLLTTMPLSTHGSECYDTSELVLHHIPSHLETEKKASPEYIGFSIGFHLYKRCVVSCGNPDSYTRSPLLSCLLPRLHFFAIHALIYESSGPHRP
jgi:hypothetical protein